MPNTNRRKLIQRLRTLSKAVIISQGPAADHGGLRALGQGPQECLISDDRYLEFLTAVSEAILDKPELNSKFTTDQIAMELGDIIGLMARNPAEEPEQLLLKLYDRADSYAKEQIVVVPLTGIRLELPSVTFGPVTLTTAIAERYPFLNAMSRLEAPPDSPKGKQSHADEMIAIPAASLLNNVCVEFHTIASQERARELTPIVVGQILDLLRFAFAIDYPQAPLENFGFLREIRPQWHIMFVIAKDRSEISLKSESIGGTPPFVLNDTSVNRLRELNVFTMAELLTLPREKVTDFERTLLHSIRWFSSALTQRSADDTVLGLFVCIETLFTSGDLSQPVTNAVAEGVAFILGKDHEERISIRRRMKQLYGIRSDITHGRESRESDAIAHELSQLAGRCLVVLLGRKSEYPEKKALLDWIEERRMS